MTQRGAREDSRGAREDSRVPSLVRTKARLKCSTAQVWEHDEIVEWLPSPMSVRQIRVAARRVHSAALLASAE
eukprot:scaffold11216_cov126-Isochrysis_galbana.AAC.3